MGKLMKYEWKKQRTSRMIVMVALAVCVLTFLGGVLVEKDALMGIQCNAFISRYHVFCSCSYGN